MKNTRYFDDYQSAYNYYGGAVVPSTEIALVGNGSYVFVSSDNAFGGNQQYFDANLTNDEIVDNLTYTAYNQGFSYGESVTYPIAYEAGYSYGYDIGEIDGYDAGYAEGQAAGGSTSLTTEQLNNMSLGAVLMSLYDTGTQSSITMQPADLDYLDAEAAKATMNATNLQFTVDKYNETDGLTIDYNATFDTDNTTYMKVQVSLDAGDKVGFSLTPANADGMGDYLFEDPCSWLYRYVDPDNTGMGYNTHWFDVQNAGNYKFEITFGTDPESGDSTVEGYTFTEVQP